MLIPMKDKLPEYYPWMYQDGYKPWQILQAFRETVRHEMEEDSESEVQIV